MNRREFITFTTAMLAGCTLPLRFLADIGSTAAISAVIPSEAEHGDLLIKCVAQHNRLVVDYKIHDGLNTGWTNLFEQACPTGDEPCAAVAAFTGVNQENPISLSEPPVTS
jgi:hypothetical protein